MAGGVSGRKPLDGVEQIKSLFPEDEGVTRSVIGLVLGQNEGCMEDAYDTLFALRHDPEAIRQLREMSREQREQHARECVEEFHESVSARQERVREEAARLGRDVESLERVNESLRDHCREKRELLEGMMKGLREVEERRVGGPEASLLLSEMRRRLLLSNMRRAAPLGESEEGSSADESGEKEEESRLDRGGGDVWLEERDEGVDGVRCRIGEVLPLKVDYEYLPLLNGRGEDNLESEIEEMRAELERASDLLRRCETKAKYQRCEIEHQKSLLTTATERLARMNARMESLFSLVVEYLGDWVAISWEFPDAVQPTAKDWIGLYNFRDSSGRYLTCALTDGRRRSSHFFKLPSRPGLYEARLFLNGSYEPVMTSCPFRVGPEVELKASLERTEKGDMLIRCNFSVLRGDLSDRDWIGLYRADKPSHRCLRSYPLNSLGRVEDEASSLGGYEYEFRFFSAVYGDLAIATSSRIAIPRTDSVRFEVLEQDASTNQARTVRCFWRLVTVRPSGKDLVRLVKAAGNNRPSVEASKRLNSSEFLDFLLPRLPGRYVLEYWSHRVRRVPVAVSDPILIENLDRISLTMSDVRVLTVDFSIHSVDLTPSCWIAIYPEDAASSSKKCVSYQYLKLDAVDRESRSGRVMFSPPQRPGKYQARFFSNSGYQHLVCSEPLEIT
ncbi:uncharacterized protein LOC126328219 [Schistocerca gregaria]|uniref:uncharacterized protein LOC126328219 n=1 Tax=Schistocerca gregaria TaxID=7010 RepID=UPI00211E27A6|nr:uncharacterized protein LOC126328219 [Schistocerca gregaria]